MLLALLISMRGISSQKWGFGHVFLLRARMAIYDFHNSLQMEEETQMDFILGIIVISEFHYFSAVYHLLQKAN